MRITSGSIGALELTLEVEVKMRDLNELDHSWAKLSTIDAHKKRSKELEPYTDSSGDPSN